MKQIIIQFTGSIMLFFSSLIFGQNKGHKDPIVTDDNPVYTIHGDKLEEGLEKKVIFADGMSISGINKEDIAVNNNNIIFKKSGIYKVTLRCDISDEEVKRNQIAYSVFFKGKRAFGKDFLTLPKDGKYFFQIQVNEGDLMSFGIGSINQNSNLKSNIQVQYTDPSLITIKEG